MIPRIKTFINQQGFKKYFQNTSWLFAEKIIRMISGLVIGIWVARYLGPVRFGLLNYAMSIVALFSVFSTLGLDGILVRDLVKNKEKNDALLGTAFSLKISAAFIVLFVLAIALNFTSNDRYTNIIIFIIAAAPVFHSFDVIDCFFQSKVQSRFVVFAKIISLFVSSIIKIALILLEAPLVAFAWTILFDSFILALGFIYFYSHNQLSMSSWKFEKSTALNLLQESWPLLLSGIFITIYLKIDQLMIKEMMNDESVGYYAAAVRLSEIWYFIPIVISSSLFPAIIHAKEASERLYYHRLQKLYDLMVWLAVLIALPLTFFSDRIVNILYGPEYQQAGLVLTIHIWSALFMFLLHTSGRWLIIENLTRYALYRNCSGALLNIILNFFLIKLYGIVGAAVATLISYAFSGFLFDFLPAKTRVSFYLKLNAIMFKSFYKKNEHINNNNS